MTSAEQDKERRIQAVADQYSRKEVVVTEKDNWENMMASQIYAMKRRGNLPEHYTYQIDIQGDL